MGKAAVLTVLAGAVLAWLTGGPAHALAPDKGLAQLSVEHWRVKDGLPGDSVLALAQASDGQLWIATLGGLAHYDGIRFTRVATPAGDGWSVIPDVRRLLAAPDGSVWAASPYRRPRRFVAGAPQTNRPLVGWPEGHSPQAWAQDARGEIWVATAAGLVRLSGDRVLGPPRPLAQDKLTGPLRATELRFDRSGTAWLGTERGLHSLVGDRLARHPGVPADAAVTALHEDRRGVLWVATGQRLYRLDGAQTRSFGPAQGLPAGPIVELADDEDGNLWLASPQGLARLHEGSVRLFTMDDGLPERDITAVLVDREGSLWVGTRNGGLSQFTARTVDTSGVPAVASDVEVTSLCEDDQGAMWFALRDRGVVRAAPRAEGGGEPGGSTDRTDVQHYTRAQGLPSDGVWAVLPARTDGADAPVASAQPGDVWIGTNDGLRRWRGGVIQDPGIWNEMVGSLYIDRRGALWIGGNGQLGRLSSQGLRRYGAADGLPPRQVRSMAEDPQGVLWVGGIGIPPLVALSGDRFIRPEVLHRRRLGPVRSMWADRSGTFWLSTDRSGLLRLRGNDVTLFAAREFDAEMVYQLLEDDAGDFWLGTNKSLLRIARASLDPGPDGQRGSPEVIALDTTDRRSGVVASALRQPSAWKARNGRLWFATARGAVSVDPRRVRTNLVRPPVVIEQVRVDGRPLVTGGEAQLDPGPRRLEIHYAARTLLDPRRVRYRHRLEGIDRDWVDAGGGRIATYTDLPAGSYRFQVLASNSDGLWNDAGASLRFTVAPPVFSRPWFYGLCALALVPIAFGIYRLRVARLRAQYAGMFAERSRMARELHDTILQGMSGIGLQLHAIRAQLSRAPEQSQRELDELQETVGRCLEETRRVVWDLRGRSETGGDLGPALSRFARRLFKEGNTRCDVEVQGKPRHLPHVVENELFRIAQEGLRNASAHAGAQRVSVKLDYQADQISLSITDDGRGFAINGVEQSAETSGHFGLRGLRERAAQIGGRVQLDSAPGQGTTVLITVPSPAEVAHG